MLGSRNFSSQLGHAPRVAWPRTHRCASSLVSPEIGIGKWKLPYATLPFPANLWSYFKYSAPFAFWINRWVLSALQRKHGFDVWHAVVLSPAGICFANWQSRTRVPGLVRAVGDDVQSVDGSKHNPHWDELLRRWIPKVQRVVSLSRDMSAQLGNLGVPTEKIELISNAVDQRRFRRSLDQMQTRDEFQISRNAFLFLVWQGIIRKKICRCCSTHFRRFPSVVPQELSTWQSLAVACRRFRVMWSHSAWDRRFTFLR
jgi:hypothetical protein